MLETEFNHRDLKCEYTAHYPNGQESWMNSILWSLALIGFKLHRFSSAVQLSELIYVFLRL
jgi:hypothetical protein